MLYISRPESINDLRPSFGITTKTKKSRCQIERYIDNVFKTSDDSELISRQDIRKSKTRSLVG